MGGGYLFKKEWGQFDKEIETRMGPKGMKHSYKKLFFKGAEVELESTIFRL